MISKRVVMAKELLFVGDHLEADLMQEPLRRAGIVLHAVSTVLEAEEFLRSPESSRMDLAVLVQPNLALLSPDDTRKPEIEERLKHFDDVDTCDRGEVFVQHAQKSGLLPRSVPVYLASYDKPHKLPEGFSGFFSLGARIIIGAWLRY
jgi:hypothetical protein